MRLFVASVLVLFVALPILRAVDDLPPVSKVEPKWAQPVSHQPDPPKPTQLPADPPKTVHNPPEATQLPATPPLVVRPPIVVGNPIMMGSGCQGAMMSSGCMG